MRQSTKANMSRCWAILSNARTTLKEDCRKVRQGDSNDGELPYNCRYITLDSDICNKPAGNVHFLKGVYKIQKGKELDLTDEEKDAVEIFRIVQPAEATGRIQTVTATRIWMAKIETQMWSLLNASVRKRFSTGRLASNRRMALLLKLPHLNSLTRASLLERTIRVNELQPSTSDHD
jgi:hypothetical protein